MNAKKLFAVAALAALTLTGTHVKAQWQDIAAMNAQFDANFDIQARQFAWQYATTHRGQPCPFNAMTISQSITNNSNAALGMVEQNEVNSNRALAATDRFDTYAIQGNGYYAPEYPSYQGEQYILPYTTAPEGGYNIQNGYIMPGYEQGGNNLNVVDPND